ncbi:ABC transporter permease [Candidatus Uabimicrobium amorphum]|uniref:ABC transporter permease n=2 Tax=Uabimicrobium amorphum TaxID=2596890 RepID=A0A5S9IT87_UABAM|nr:ABC transporter permease [Candidatus Uabimicrobium amorphum]
MTVVATAFAYATPLLIGFVIDHVIAQKPTDWSQLQQFFLHYGLWLVAISLVCFAIAEGIFSYTRSHLAQRAAEGIVRDIREKLYDHMQHLRCTFHNANETGDLVQRSTSDVETIRRFLAMHVPEIARSCIMVIAVIPIMLSLSGAMTIIATITIPIVFLFTLVFFRKMQKAFKIADEAEASMTTTIQENLTASRVVRAFARKNYEIEKFSQKNATYRDHHYRVICLIAWYWSISDFICLIQIAAVLFFGSLWTVAGHISLGVFVTFVTYETMLLWPVRHMGRILADFGKTTVAAQRIAHVLNETQEQGEYSNIEIPEGDVCFENVSFGYEEGRPALQNISFRVNKGKTVALLGATGAGKSTVVKLLMRLYDCNNGRITIGGVDIKTVQRKALREQIGIVLQNPFLYSKTIYENLLWGNLHASEDNVYKAAETAAIHNTIQNFADGYQTQLGERGVTLSGGQKQRTAIARTLLRETPILIFDDSFSAVDTDTESSILQSLRNKMKATTTLIIAHRLSTVINADWIVFLERGKIVQQGTHKQLMNEPGAYQRIWKMQHNDEVDIIPREHAPPCV